jgi:hypothetical protein
MWNPGLIFSFLSCFFATALFAKADDATCDYYDLYGKFIITFPKDTQLDKSGPSAVSGITFIFPNNSTLRISPTAELTTPNEVVFIQDYAHNGCNITKTENDKKTKITCNNYEYSIIEANNQDHKVYIKIYYDFKNKKYDSLYHGIVDSLALVQKYPLDEFKFYNAARQANFEYYYGQDATYQRLVDEYKIPDIVCGRHRIRDKMLQNP